MTIPTDPIFAQQWHLRNTAANQYDLNVMQAWNAGITGAGVRVFVADDGFDTSHPDIAPNYVSSGQFDYPGNDLSPLPGGQGAVDSHGTACMGIIGAARNGSGAVGVSYGADLTGIRGFDGFSDFDTYIEDLGRGMIRAMNAGADVLSMSSGYGGSDTYFDAGLSAAALASCRADIGEAVREGRDGLGLIMVKAAGNERADGYNTNTLSIDADPRLISVASVDRFGRVDDYSNYGGNVLVAGFGSPGQIVTTDRRGADGYSGGNFTFDFNGTSAATPQVAGVVALMLQANPGLGWRDVQDILAASARVVGSGVGGDGAQRTGFEVDVWTANRSEQWNGGGVMFSNDYGFGLVDAGAAVRLAQSWFATGGVAQTSANQEVRTLDFLNSPRNIPDANPNGVTLSGFIGVPGENFEIGYTTVTIAMSPRHSFAGDLTILLRNGGGDIAVLHDGEGEGTDVPGTWSFTTRQFRGEDAQGSWFVDVIDNASGDTGTLTDVVLRHFGDEAVVNDRHIVTDQFALFAAENGRRTIADTNGGLRDTLNAAALSTGATIILNGAVNSRIDGTTARVDASIENVIGGLGSDVVTGSARANLLQGRDGNDTLSGGSGSDDLRGSNGADRLDGGTGRDVLTGGNGADRFVFTAAPGLTDADTILDFNKADDTIYLDNADFAGLAIGTLRFGQFTANGTGAATASGQRIIQDTDDGRLYFDRDGNGAAARQMFAVIDTDALIITRFDIVIF
jgi:subtilisin family serine protease